MKKNRRIERIEKREEEERERHRGDYPVTAHTIQPLSVSLYPYAISTPQRTSRPKYIDSLATTGYPQLHTETLLNSGSPVVRVSVSLVFHPWFGRGAFAESSKLFRCPDLVRLAIHHLPFNIW